jgi:hypothetical protein
MGYAIQYREIVVPGEQMPPRPEPKLRLVERAQTREPSKKRGPHLRRPVKVTTDRGEELVFKSHSAAWAQLRLPPNKIIRIAIAAMHSGSATIRSEGTDYTFTFVELV